jgi:3,5-dihydroxyphenylacetyl-CoA synthase
MSKAESVRDFSKGNPPLILSEASRCEPRLLGVGTATTPISYSQLELLDQFRIADRRARAVFLNSSIHRRNLVLPLPDKDGIYPNESEGDLLKKHKEWSINIGSGAIKACLYNCGATTSEISYLCCVTTTGFLTPGVSALISRQLRLAEDCTRLDVVGMGCSAGLNALNATAGWARANPGKLAIMLCVEICSACYVFDGTIATAVVNSLFGDGAAAAAVRVTRGIQRPLSPIVLKFYGCTITSAIDAMRFDWDDKQGKFQFFLDPEVPYIVGANVSRVVDGLLLGTGLRRWDIRHWLVHSGGKKVIDVLRVNLGLSAYDLRHTIGVLKDQGNLSSASFLYSYERLLREGGISNGDFGVMLTMGPGSAIESALLQW